MAGDLLEYAKNVMSAREAVKQAEIERAKGGSLKKLNAANRELADANHAYWQCSGGLALDR